MRVIILLLILSSTLWAKPRLVLLKAKNPAAYAPSTYFFNIGFDTSQNREVFDQNSMRYSRIFRYMSNPGRYIHRDGGTDELIDAEFFGKGAFSNFGLHLLGGGFDFRYLYEWYAIKGYAFPWLMAFMTAYAGNITNEAFETSYAELTSHDHLADLYFFDLVGKLLFTSDAIASLFYDSLGMRSWVGMPMIDTEEKKIFNASLNYFIRSSSGTFRPFFLWGMYQMAGVSIELAKEFFITPALGIFLLDPFELTFKISSAVFIDYHDRLLSSFHINGGETMEYKFCLYPPFFSRSEKLNIGLMVGRTDDKEFSFGVTIHTPIGFGKSETFR